MRTSPRSSGWAFAGALLASVSTSVAFRLDAATFAVSAAALLLMRYRAPARAAAERSARAVWGELREGFNFLARDRGLRANTTMIVVCVAGLGACVPAHLPVRRQRPGRRDRRLRRPGGGRRRRLPRRLAGARGAGLPRAQGPGHDRRTGDHGRLPRAGRDHRLRVGRGRALRHLRDRQRRRPDRGRHVPAAGRPRGHARAGAGHAVHAHAGDVRGVGPRRRRPGRPSSTCGSSSSSPARSWRRRPSWAC